jgi:hypothetical protein
MTTRLRWLFLLFVPGFILAIAYAPLPIPHHLDFLAIYHANLGVLRGVPLYDLAGQVDMIADLANVTPDQVSLLPFVYPPWYALLTLPLALFPIDMAARLWFAVNLLLIIMFVWLVSDDWPTQRRVISFLLAILFLPVLGALYVGQFVFPVLLGAGVLVYAISHEKVWLAAIALFLLTFKPHIGGLVFLAVIVHLLLKRNAFARRVLWMTSAILLFFFTASFFVDSGWPVHYFQTLFGFREVSPCEGLCISVPMAITSIFGADFTQAVWIAVILLLGWMGLFWRTSPDVRKDAKWLIAVSFCITLLSSPYQYNYDFVALLLPFFLLTITVRSKSDWLWLAIAYFLPWIGLIFGRQGNQVLLISTFGLMILVWQKSKSEQSLLDGHPQAMYNQRNSLREE